MSEDWVLEERGDKPYIITRQGIDVGVSGSLADSPGTDLAILAEIVASRNACKDLGHPEAIKPLVKQLKHCLEQGFKDHDAVTLQALVSHLENGG